MSNPFEEMGRTLGVIAEHVRNIHAGLTAGLERGIQQARDAAEEERRREAEYRASEQYQLDLMTARYGDDPIAHSEAVCNYFTKRVHRELDAVLARIAWEGPDWNELVAQPDGVHELDRPHLHYRLSRKGV